MTLYLPPLPNLNHSVWKLTGACFHEDGALICLAIGPELQGKMVLDWRHIKVDNQRIVRYLQTPFCPETKWLKSSDSVPLVCLDTIAASLVAKAPY